MATHSRSIIETTATKEVGKYRQEFDVFGFDDIVLLFSRLLGMQKEGTLRTVQRAKVIYRYYIYKYFPARE